MRRPKWLTRTLLSGLIGIILGALIILGIRFFTYKPDRVHYHANFAVYINGQHQLFQDDFYYEAEGAACTAESEITPHDRAHMHDHVNNVVHVHDRAVTWNDFFQNIGWEINPLFVRAIGQLYLADASHKVTFILNGQPVDNAAQMVIADKSKLLVDYGDGSSQQLQTEYQSIPSTAAKYDTSRDPASCGSQAPPTFHDRISHLF